MKTRALGTSGLSVSEIGLGGMPLSIVGRPDRAQAFQVIHAALDGGMTLIDTADVYCLDDGDIGHNERLIRDALRAWGGDRDSILLATKGGLERPEGQWTTNGRPEHLKAACERSLTALGVDVIDLYQLHAPDDDVPFAESVGALKDLQGAGKLRHVGLSNVSVAEIKEAQGIVEVVSVQNRCNIFDRGAFEGGVVAHCEAEGIAFLPHSPVGGHRGHTRLKGADALSEVAAAHGASTYEIALAWLLAVSPSMIVIPGASRVESAVSSARAGAIALSPSEVERLTKEVS